jgi:hypothetical protein
MNDLNNVLKDIGLTANINAALGQPPHPDARRVIIDGRVAGWLMPQVNDAREQIERRLVKEPLASPWARPAPAMTDYRAVALAEGFEDGTEEERIEAWQHLHTTGLAYRLQGCFGRMAQDMLAQGIIS